MKIFSLALFAAISATISLGDTLASFVTKDSVYEPYTQEQENQAGPVDYLAVGKIKTPQIQGGDIMPFLIAPRPLARDEFTSYLSQSPVLTTSKDSRMSPSSFEVCSFSMSAASGYLLDLQSFSFSYSQLAHTNISVRDSLSSSGWPNGALPGVPIEFTLMAKVNGGEFISLGTQSVAGGTADNLWVIEQDVTFDLTSEAVKKQIGNATNVEFSLQGVLGDAYSSTPYVHLALANISVNGEVVSNMVPEPSSTLLWMFGLVPFLTKRRK